MEKVTERRFLRNELSDMKTRNHHQHKLRVPGEADQKKHHLFPSENGLHIWGAATVQVLDLFKETEFFRFHISSGLVERFLSSGEPDLSNNGNVEVLFFRELADDLESAVIVYRCTNSKHCSDATQSGQLMRLLLCRIDQGKRLLPVVGSLTLSETRLEYAFVHEQNLYLIHRAVTASVDRRCDVYQLSGDLHKTKSFPLPFSTPLPFSARLHNGENAQEDEENAMAALPAPNPPPLGHRVVVGFVYDKTLFFGLISSGRSDDADGLLGLLAGLALLPGAGLPLPAHESSTPLQLYRLPLSDANDDASLTRVLIEATAENQTPRRLNVIGAVGRDRNNADPKQSNVMLLTVQSYSSTQSQSVVWKLLSVGGARDAFRWQSVSVGGAGAAALKYNGILEQRKQPRVCVMPNSSIVALQRPLIAPLRDYHVLDLAHPPPKSLHQICCDFLRQPRYVSLPDHVQGDCVVPKTAGLYCPCIYC